MEASHMLNVCLKFAKKHLPWIFVALLALATRFVRLDIIPPWDGDEDIYVFLSNGFWSGRHEMFAIPYSYIPHPPFFFMIGNFFTAVFGSSIVTLRGLTALSGMLSCVVLYFFATKIEDRKLGLLSALALIFSPGAIIFNRFAYGYSLLMFLSIALFFVYHLFSETFDRAEDGDVFPKARIFYALLAGVVAGLAAISELGGLFLVLVLLIVFLFFHRSYLKYLIGGAIGIPALVYGILFLRSPTWMMADLFGNSGRGKAILFICFVAFLVVLFILPPIRKSIKHITEFASAILPWIWPLFLIGVFLFPATVDNINHERNIYWLGLIGLLYLPQKKTRLVCLLSTAVYLLFILYLNRADRMIVPLLPVMALGIGLIVWQSWSYFQRFFSKYIKNNRSVFFCAGILACLPLFLTAWQSWGLVDHVSEESKAFYTANHQIVSYLDSHTEPDDLVIIAGPWGSMIRAHIATVLQLDYYGETDIDPVVVGEAYPQERYLYPLSLEEIDFVAMPKVLVWFIDGYVDPSLVESVNQDVYEELAPLEQRMNTIKQWPRVEIGEYLLFENPIR